MKSNHVSLSNIHVILVNTTHPGNIGATARAMKNMGLTELRLVNPERYPAAEATWRAAGADDVLEKATIYPSLLEAIADCGLVVGTTARERALTWHIHDVRSAVSQIVAQTESTKIALLFGQERMGLTNEELELCHFLLHIPCNPEYASLNIAAAVQVIAYELRMAIIEQPAPILPEELISDPATAAEMEKFYQHLEQIMVEVGFKHQKSPGSLMDKLRRLFNRAHVAKNELNILRGILAAVERRIK